MSLIEVIPPRKKGDSDSPKVSLSLRRKGAMSLQVSIMKRHEGSYLITLEGRLDSSTYPDFEERIGPALTGSQGY